MTQLEAESMISEASVRRAIDHLGAFGDTDLFPRLPEMRCFIEKPDAIVRDCERLNIGQYTPTGATETLTPKSSLGFRIAHQLTASDNLIYLAALLDCAPQLEASRSPREEKRAFAYRFDSEPSERIFEVARGYHQWIAHVAEFGELENPFSPDRPAIITDISDFYQRIYFHRIENVLQDAGCLRGPTELIKKVIKTSRARQSYGLPVGTTASRLLAECLLNDTDQFLRGMGVDFTRYVDDFRIVVPDGDEAHSLLCRLAEHLMVTEGLSLNVSKTKITVTSAMKDQAKSRLKDVFTTAEMERMNAFITLNYADGDDELEEDSISNPFLTAEFLMERMKELGRRQGADLSIFKAVLRALRFLPDIDVMQLLQSHADLLYFMPREFCLVISAAAEQEAFPKEDAKARVIELLGMPPFRDLSYVRSWLLNLFVDGTLPVVPSDWRGYNFMTSIAERRARLFFQGLSNNRAFFRAAKTQLGAMSEWERTAAMLGGMCLPADEYRNWLDEGVRQLSTPFASTYVSWLKDNHGSLAAILADHYS